MNRLSILPLSIIIMLLGLLPVACIDDSFTTASSDLLTFSCDTLSFDTVFTDVGTPTARLRVYNRAKKSVNISQIRFKKDDSNFQLNVDGMSGSVFNDVEIRGGDSIYIFVECYIDATQGNEPYLVEDKLQFITNGVEQDIQVEAYGQNVTRLRNQRITADTRYTADRPYVVFDSLVVDKGATLTIEPGARILFHDKAEMIVHGTLNASGDVGKMIQLRGDRLDDVLPDVSYDIMSGQWGGIRFAPESFDNKLEYVDMRSSSTGVAIDSCGNLDRRKLLLRNSWLHNSSASVLSSKYAWVDAYGVCFSEAGSAVVELTGGKHNMVHCTFANNYLFSIPVEGILTLNHLFPTDAETDSQNPLMEATFANSIIYGIGTPISVFDLKDTNVWLYNVLFGLSGDNDEHFLSCLWDSDPLFLTVRNDYYFNYHLYDDSPAANSGNRSFVDDNTLIDMDGVNRLASGADPTLGAYAKAQPKE